MVRYCEKMMPLSLALSRAMATIACATASTLLDDCHCAMFNRCRIVSRPTVTDTALLLLELELLLLELLLLESASDVEVTMAALAMALGGASFAFTTLEILARHRGQILLWSFPVHSMHKTMCPHGK